MTGHYELHGPWLNIRALGLPVPQGSMRSLGKGRPSVHDNAARLRPWRAVLVDAIEQAIEHARPFLTDGHTFPLDGPLAVDVTFTLPKPKSAPKTRRTFPMSAPDVDKLQRALGDALTIAGAIVDDARIVQWGARRAYPLETPQALAVPGLLAYVHTIAP